MRQRDQIAYLHAEIDRLQAELAQQAIDLAHYDRIVQDHNALYDLLRDAGLEIYSADGERWTVVVRGQRWDGYESAIEAARAGLLRLCPR